MSTSRWTHIKRTKLGKNIYSLYICTCGTYKEIRESAVNSGRSLSCGCLHSEVTVKRNTSHGMYGTPTYGSWVAMKRRCHNRCGKNPTYVDVSYCESWATFEGFLSDMGERPEGTTLGRTADSGNYELGNCNWQTCAEQGLNKSIKNEYRRTL